MTTAVQLNVRHDLATPADQHPMTAPGPVRVVHRGDVLAQPEISADTARRAQRASFVETATTSSCCCCSTKLALVPAS
jgi:hypothetical protein